MNLTNTKISSMYHLFFFPDFISPFAKIIYDIGHMLSSYMLLTGNSHRNHHYQLRRNLLILTKLSMIS